MTTIKSGLRLPNMPAGLVAPVSAAALAPAPPTPPAPMNETDAIELGFRHFPAGPLGSYPTNAPVTIYTTKRRRTGVDVYVTFTNTVVPNPTLIRIWVYAITGSSRSLVETGWFFEFTAGATQRVAAARAIADRFEVVAQICLIAGATALPDVLIQAEASDWCLDIDPTDLAISLSLVTQGDPMTMPPFVPAQANFASFLTRLTGAIVTNTTAAVLYWQAVDAADVASANLAQPVVSVAVPAKTTVLVPSELLQGYRFGAFGCVCGGSSTPAFFTAAASGAILQQVWGQ